MTDAGRTVRAGSNSTWEAAESSALARSVGETKLASDSARPLSGSTERVESLPQPIPAASSTERTPHRADFSIPLSLGGGRGQGHHTIGSRVQRAHVAVQASRDVRVLARSGEESLTSSPSDGGRMRWGSANSELWREADYRQIRNLDIEVGIVISNVLQGGGSADVGIRAPTVFVVVFLVAAVFDQGRRLIYE